MAFNVSILDKSVFGNLRSVAISAVADANSGVIVTGLSVIYGMAVTPHSAATNGQNFKRNLNAASAAAQGSIMASSCANGEVFHIVAWGK